MEALISNINLRFPIASIFILLIIGIFNARSKPLPTYSRHAFKIMYNAMLLNIIAELGTLYCLYNYDSCPHWINDMTHKIFILSLNLVVLQFFIYVLRLCLKGAKLPVSFLLLTLAPFAASIALSCFGEINYFIEYPFVYSYGPFPTSVYICILCYIIAAIILLIMKGKDLDRAQCKSLWFALGFWIVATVIQLLNPRLLLSSLSGSSLLFFMYLSLENPREFFNEDINCFNPKAFSSVASEQFTSKNTFYVITVFMPGLQLIKSKFGQGTYNRFLQSISGYLVKYVKHEKRHKFIPVYHIQSNSLTIILNTSHENVAEYCEKMENLLSQSWSIGTITCALGAQVFAIECPKFAKDVDTINNTISFFTSNPSVQDNFFIDEKLDEKRLRHQQIQMLIKDAIDNDGFDVYYQPIYSTTNKKFTSAEALVRLKNKSIGFISPEEFIPIAEQDNSIMELGRIVFEKVCKLASSINLNKLGVEYIEVNLSGIQCMSPDIYSLLKRIMTRYNIEPSFINLEVTETAAVDATDALEKNMALLCDFGCSFSLDDFGTGYSNLTQIIRFPFNIIKLDKSLVWGYFDDSKPQLSVLTYNIINMIDQLDLEIVAEGVETKEMVDTLTAMKVGHLQGYYFSKPIPEDDFVNFIIDGNRNA